MAHAERAHERRSVTRRPHESRQSTPADGADGGRATHQQVGAYRVGLASTPSESAARPGGAGRPRDATAARLVLTADQARQASQRGGDRVCSRAHGLHLGIAPRPGRNRNGGRNVSLSAATASQRDAQREQGERGQPQPAPHHRRRPPLCPRVDHPVLRDAPVQNGVRSEGTRRTQPRQRRPSGRMLGDTPRHSVMHQADAITRSAPTAAPSPLRRRPHCGGASTGHSLSGAHACGSRVQSDAWTFTVRTASGAGH